MQTIAATLVATLLALAAGAAAAGSITGTATYRERIAVPPGAVLEVSLLDVSRADAPAVVLSSKRLALESVPAEFDLQYDDALIVERASYVVSAAILVDEVLQWRTDTAYPVLTRGGSDRAELMLVRTVREARGLEDTSWQVTELDGRPLTTEKRPALAFARAGQFGATGGCNRFSGTAEIVGGDLVFPDNMAGTLMACPPPYDQLEKDFLDAMTRVTGYMRNGDLLVLVDPDGTPVIQLTRSGG